MTETKSIFKGDDVSWLIGFRQDDGTLADLSANWVCRLTVSGTAINKTITDLNGDSTRFIAALTPTETDTLEVGQYVVAIELENTTLTPPLRRERHIILTVNEQGVGGTEDIAPETDVARLTRELAEVKAQRHKVMTGGGVVQVTKDGRSVRKFMPSIKEYNEFVQTLERELAEAERLAAGKHKRRPINLRWS